MAKNFPSREENYSQWYNEIITRADLAEHSDVRGCMIIKPYGYAIWEKMQQTLDNMFKETGHVNAYFPLFIPKSYLSKEEKHVEGFAKECAVVTHYRLKSENGEVVVDSDAKLEEELIVRPTSETIIWNTYKNWIQSYRDLPLLVNQWANVVRWEMRTRLFLRTAEFLWQEGHTAHATKKEAIQEAEQMLEVYTRFAQDYMGVKVIQGVKTESERFAGAEETYCIEALMQDGKALQAGTSHFLGQNFAKAFDVKYASKEGKLDYVWATSWGVTTRLIGALVMSHSDDNGLVLPPKLAPIQVVIIPIYRKDEEFTKVNEVCEEITASLRKKGILVKYDNRDTHKPGYKFNEYEFKGVPVRIAIGPKDLEKGTVEVSRRDLLQKEFISKDRCVDYCVELLDAIQKNLFAKNAEFGAKNTHQVENYDDFKTTLEEKAGFVDVFWAGNEEDEERIQKETKATIRCIPLEQKGEQGVCFYTGKETKQRVLFAKAY